MDKIKAIKEYIDSEDNRLEVETNAQLMALRYLVEELYCTAKGIDKQEFANVFDAQVDHWKIYLYDREVAAVKKMEEEAMRKEEEQNNNV